MSNLDNLIDRLNKYLTGHGLPKIVGQPKDLFLLYESALRSVWNLKDKEKREIMAIEIAKALKNYYGGKNLEAALEQITQKLNKEENEKVALKQKREKQAKMNDPNYKPSFDELFNS